MREQISPQLDKTFQTAIFSMFDADLSQQHSSRYGSRFSVKAKETTWSQLYGNSLRVTSDGAFTGMDLGAGGSKPPSYRE